MSLYGLCESDENFIESGTEYGVERAKKGVSQWDQTLPRIPATQRRFPRYSDTGGPDMA